MIEIDGFDKASIDLFIISAISFAASLARFVDLRIRLDVYANSGKLQMDR